MWWLLSARYLVLAALAGAAVFILWVAVTNRE
jgi:hypothetical protein